MPVRLTKFRMKMNLSRSDLARMAGINTDTLGRIERGARKPFSGTARKIAEVLGIHPREIEEFAGIYPAPDGTTTGPRPLREIRQEAYLGTIDLTSLSGVSYGIITAIELKKIKPHNGLLVHYPRL